MHEEPRKRRLRILVVDDNHDGAMMLSNLLELNGYQTNTAHNGLDAVRAAGSAHYDAVLLDLGMPIMDGFEAAAVLGQLRPAPVLLHVGLGRCADTPAHGRPGASRRTCANQSRSRPWRPRCRLPATRLIQIASAAVAAPRRSASDRPSWTAPWAYLKDVVTRLPTYSKHGAIDADWRHGSINRGARQLQRHKLAGIGGPQGPQRRAPLGATCEPCWRSGHGHLGYRGAAPAAFGQHLRLELQGIRAHSRVLDWFARVHSNPLVDTMFAAAGEGGKDGFAGRSHFAIVTCQR